ncbi:hypothetical protein LSCM1_02894 [Leishmania martiniquensis]|uniref:Protein kinase domain-containing protein n=1 Tax=Leishmania martiniquensis TaxID=1580590 RepID=A0A836HLK3_9TRYP|nr:hypothetical protein LSCM1_02894 [Leishmania martiniquensis]
MSEKPPQPRRRLSAARPSAHMSAASRPRTQKSISSDDAARLPTTTPVYRPVRYVGRGSFGVVVLAEEVHSGEKVAIKRVHYDARLHNREVSILNSVLVDDPRQPPSSNTAPDSDSASRFTGGATGVSFSPSQSALSSSHRMEDVHLWGGSHHPHIVKLFDFYVTYDAAASEQAPGVEMTHAAGADAGFGFLPSHHSTERRCPWSGDGGGRASANSPAPTAPLPGFTYLEMVMSYLPMDLSYVKKYFFRFHKMPTLRASASPSPLTSPEQRPVELSSGALQEGVGGRSPASGKQAGAGCSATDSSGHGNTCSGGGDACHHLPLRWVKVVLFQLARALAFMHARHVCHRDLKPANVLVDPDSGRVQLCDFGSAKQIMRPAEEKNVSYICSRYYRAPELLFGALHYGCAVDMWSFGCIAAELLRESGRPLFRGCTSVDQMTELFKVLGAPSKREMYAMNPQCAEALLRTRAMHRHQSFNHHPYSEARGGGGMRGGQPCRLELELDYHAEDDDDDVELRGDARQGEFDVDGNGDFLRDALDDGISPPTASSLGMATASSASPSTTDARRCKTGYTVPPSTATAARLDDVAPTLFEEYYDVLKVRAIPWRMLFPTDTPTEALTLVASLLCYAPEKRLTAAELVEHSFFDDLFSAADTQPVAVADGDAATAMASGTAPPHKDDEGSASEALRLPNGRLMPLVMFQVTEVERSLYTNTFLARMARQAELLAAAVREERHS